MAREGPNPIPQPLPWSRVSEVKHSAPNSHEELGCCCLRHMDCKEKRTLYTKIKISTIVIADQLSRTLFLGQDPPTVLTPH